MSIQLKQVTFLIGMDAFSPVTNEERNHILVKSRIQKQGTRLDEIASYLIFNYQFSEITLLSSFGENNYRK